MELGGRTLFRMGLCGQEGRARWGGGRRTCKVMQAWQALLGTLLVGVRTQVVCARQKWSGLLNCDELFHARGTWEGHNLGNVALPMSRFCRDGSCSLSVSPSHQLGNTSFLERKFGCYNSTLGVGITCRKAGTNLLQRFLAHCIDTLRSSIMGDTQGKVSTKMWVS